MQRIADFLRDEVLSIFPDAIDVHTDPAMILANYVQEYEVGKRCLGNVNIEDVRPVIANEQDNPREKDE